MLSQVELSRAASNKPGTSTSEEAWEEFSGWCLRYGLENREGKECIFRLWSGLIREVFGRTVNTDQLTAEEWALVRDHVAAFVLKHLITDAASTSGLHELIKAFDALVLPHERETGDWGVHRTAVEVVPA